VAQKLSRNQLAEANRNRAVVLAHEGKLEQARDELKQAIITRPTDVDFKMELGDIYVTLGTLDLAKTEYTQARDLAPQRAEPYYKVAVAAKKQGDLAKKDGKEDAAKKAYEEALENVKAATSKDDLFTPAYGLEAEILNALGRGAEAKKVMDNEPQKAPVIEDIEAPAPTPMVAPGTR
jgi:Flp pilus assembly protein TadD